MGPFQAGVDALDHATTLPEFLPHTMKLSQRGRRVGKTRCNFQKDYEPDGRIYVLGRLSENAVYGALS